MTYRFLAFAGALLLSAAASAQMPAPKPGPEQKKLDYFVGNWTCDGDVKPSPMGPGFKVTSSDELKWMDGGFFVVMHSQYQSKGMGDGTAAAVLGYDADEKKYTYNEFNSRGESLVSRGTVEGDTWTWLGDVKQPPGKGRFTEKILSPASYAYKFEMSMDGANWILFMEGKCTRK
jgi:hypothetical protein